MDYQRHGADLSIHQPLFMVGGDPTTDPDFSNVLLLLHMDNVGSNNFLDTSSYAHNLGAGGAGSSNSSAQIKFGASSGLFTAATTSGVGTPTHADFILGTNDFTVEWWQYGAPTGTFWANKRTDSGNPTYGWMFYFNVAGYFQIIDSTGAGVSDWTFTPSAATWHHAALCRISGVTTFYFDGALKTKGGSANENRDLGHNACVVGQRNYNTFSATDALVGHIDDFRLTRNVGRYTGAFTPRTTAFPDS